MKVRDLMAQPTISIATDETCRRAAELMRDFETGSLIVTGSDGIIVGIVTDRDLVIRCMALDANPDTKLIGDICDLHPTTVTADMDSEEAVLLMQSSGVRRLPVVDTTNHAIGMLSMDDIASDIRRYIDAFVAVAGQYSRS